MILMRHYLLLPSIFLLVLTSGCLRFSIFDGGNDEGEHFTEFFMLGPERKPENFPSEFNVSSPQEIYLVVRNFEGKRMEYSIDWKVVDASKEDGTNMTNNLPINCILTPSRTFELDDGEELELPCTFEIPIPGEFYIFFRLHINDGVFKELRLMVLVTDK
ncbi:MAG: DUF1616 domain-containing protein [Thermoplasmatota archaeon]